MSIFSYGSGTTTFDHGALQKVISGISEKMDGAEITEFDMKFQKEL